MTEVLRELLGPLLDPAQRTFWPALLVGGLLALAVERSRLGSWQSATAAVRKDLLSRDLWLHRSSVLDLQLALSKLFLRLLGFVPFAGAAVAVAAGTARALRMLGSPTLEAPTPLVTALYSLVLFVAWDASRYLVHRLMHAVPALWAIHQVHHSAEVLTPLTFHRSHPLESALYAARGALVTGAVAGAFLWAFPAGAEQAQLAGVGVLGLLANALGGNLRHSHVWLGYGRFERWFLSPAQHQLHHDQDGTRVNYGVWLSCWDRWAGSWRASGEQRALRFGLRPDERNHAPDDLLAALLLPLRPARWLVAGLLLALAPVSARAADEDAEADDADEEAGDDDDSAESSEAPAASESVTIIDRRGRTPRVAGSAHVVDEEELERHEYNDVHRVLAPVPGVYVRGEDGYGLRPNIGLRGANSDRSAKVTLEEDGVLLGPAPYAAPAAYYFPMTTRMVGVEVFKGPAAVLHGPQTIGGAVNLRTRPTPARGGTFGLDVAYGTENTAKMHAFAGYGGRLFGVVGEGVLLGTDGFKDLDTGGPTGFLKGEGMLKLRWNTAPERRVTSQWGLKLGYSSERSDETYLGLTDADFADSPYRRYAVSQEGRMAWQRTQAELSWNLRVRGVLDVRVVAYHHYMDRSWRKLNRFADGPTLFGLLLQPDGPDALPWYQLLTGERDSASEAEYLQIGTNRRVFHAGGVMARGRWTARLGKATNQLELGLRLHSDSIHRMHSEEPHAMVDGQLESRGEDAIELENRHRAVALSAWLSDELAIGPLRVLPGVRLEVVDTRAEAIAPTPSDAQRATRAIALPGLGLHLQAQPWLAVLAGVHRGFSPVSPGASAETKPETSWNVEAGVRLGERGVRGEVIGFFNDYANLTGQCTFSGGCTDDQLGQQFNAGRVHVYGVEALLDGTIPLPAGFGVRGKVAYTWTGSSFRSSFVSGFPQFGAVEKGDSLPYVPEHQVAGSIGFEHPFGSFEVSARGQGAMRDMAGQGTIADDERIDAYYVIDLAVDVTPTEFLTLYGTVNNVTNNAYAVSRRPFGLRPGRPIYGMVGAKLRF